MEKFRKLSFDFFIQLPNLPVLLMKTYVDVHGSVRCVCVFKDNNIIIASCH